MVIWRPPRRQVQCRSIERDQIPRHSQNGPRRSYHRPMEGSSRRPGETGHVSAPALSFHIPMTGRDPDEPHRAATPLELLFDLCFVVAVAQAAGALHHDLVEGQVGHGAPQLPVRVLRDLVAVDELHLVRIGLRHGRRRVPAAHLRPDRGRPRRDGRRAERLRVPRLPDHGRRLRDHADRARRPVAACGAARTQPAARSRCGSRSGSGSPARLGACDWPSAGRWASPGSWSRGSLELAIPIWAERAGRPTPWHPEHIAERYGLFTIIVLGECVLASTARSSSRWPPAASRLPSLAWPLAACSSSSRCGGRTSSTRPRSTGASRCARRSPGATATTSSSRPSPRSGPGCRSRSTRRTRVALSPTGVALSIAVPLVIYLGTTWLLHARRSEIRRASPVGVAIILITGIALATPALGVSLAIVGMGLAVAWLVAVNVARMHDDADSRDQSVIPYFALSSSVQSSRIVSPNSSASALYRCVHSGPCSMSTGAICSK